jgi:transcriptional regulator with XRE-family HTH domain
MMESADQYSIYEAPMSIAPQRQPVPYVVILPLYMALIAGTGGVYAASNIQLANELVSRPLICVIDASDQKNPVSKISEQISRIKKIFGLTMSELATVFGVTRPTAYAWLRGAEPHQEIVEKMWMLSSWADDFERLGIAQINIYLHRPLVEGKTLLRLMTAGHQLDAAYSRINDLVASDLQMRERLHSRERRKQENNSILDISPVMTELE